MKKLLAFIFLSFLIGLFSGCGDPEVEQNSKIAVPEDLNHSHRVIGLLPGTNAQNRAEKFFDKAKFQYFNSPVDAYAALQAKKIDAVIFDRHNLKYVELANPNFKLLSNNIGEEHIVIGVAKKRDALLKEVNQFIAQYRADGTCQAMMKRWMDSAQPVMPAIPAPQHPTRKLIIGTEGLNEPMNFFGSNGKITGFDVEFGRRLGLALNAKVEFVTMNFFALFPALTSGKIDLLVANLNATPERREQFNMTDDYVDSAISVLIHRDQAAESSRGSDRITSVKDLAGRKAASLSGSVFQSLTEPLVSGVTYLTFNDNVSCIQALLSGKIDAVLLDEPVCRKAASQFRDKLEMACVYAKDSYGFGFKKGNPLAGKVSGVIRNLRNSGELARLAAKWCDPIDKNGPQLATWTHKKDFTGKNGTLHFIADPVTDPMCYIGANGQGVGLDIEIARRAAYELNMKFKFTAMDFRSEIEALRAGKADMAGGSMSITKERCELIDFSEPYYIGGLSILARKSATMTTTQSISNFSQLYNKKIGVISGTTADEILRRELPSSQAVHLNAFTDLPLALDAGKIDAFLMEESSAGKMLDNYSNLRVLDKKLVAGDYAMIFSHQESQLCQAFSQEIKKLKNSGVAARLEKKWLSNYQTTPQMALPTIKPSKGTLRYAVVPQNEPYAFLSSGSVVGYEIELVAVAAHNLGYALEPLVTDWSGYLNLVAAGKVRFGVGCTTITEERKQKLLFSEPTGQSRLVVMVKTATQPEKAAGFREQLQAAGKSLLESFDRTFVREQRWKLLAKGLGATIVITLLSAVLGTILAFGVCWMRRSPHVVLAKLAAWYVALMQGTPILVILMILYYLIFAKVNINSIMVAVIGFALNFAAYVGEMLRSGIDGIPRGQYEAAAALGFSRFAAFRRVILPQVLRRILPIYRGEFVSMLKMTSIVGYIAIEDLTKMSDLIRSRTYEAFFPLIVTALIYFVAAHLLALIITWTELQLDPVVRRNRAKGGLK